MVKKVVLSVAYFIGLCILIFYFSLLSLAYSWLFEVIALLFITVIHAGYLVLMMDDIDWDANKSIKFTVYRVLPVNTFLFIFYIIIGQIIDIVMITQIIVPVFIGSIFLLMVKGIKVSLIKKTFIIFIPSYLLIGCFLIANIIYSDEPVYWVIEVFTILVFLIYSFGLLWMNNLGDAKE